MIGSLVMATFLTEQALWAGEASVTIQSSNLTPSAPIFRPVSSVSNGAPMAQTQPAPVFQTTTQFLQGASPLSAPQVEPIETGAAAFDPDANPNLERLDPIILDLDPLAPPVPDSNPIEPEPFDPKVEVAQPIRPEDLFSSNQIQDGEPIPVKVEIRYLDEPIPPVEEVKKSSYPGLGGNSFYFYSTAESLPMADALVAEPKEEAGEEAMNPSAPVAAVEEVQSKPGSAQNSFLLSRPTSDASPFLDTGNLKDLIIDRKLLADPKPMRPLSQPLQGEVVERVIDPKLLEFPPDRVLSPEPVPVDPGIVLPELSPPIPFVQESNSFSGSAGASVVGSVGVAAASAPPGAREPDDPLNQDEQEGETAQAEGTSQSPQNPAPQPNARNADALGAQAFWWRLSLLDQSDAGPQDSAPPPVVFSSLFDRPEKDGEKEGFRFSKKRRRPDEDRLNLFIRGKNERETLKKPKSLNRGSSSTD